MQISRRRIQIVLLMICFMLLGAMLYAIGQQVYETATIKNVGVIRVVGVEVYQDQNLTVILDYIDWGTIPPNETVYYQSWIKNTGSDRQKLVLWTENWVPNNASDFMDFTWDYDDSWIDVNASIPVTFSLYVHPDISGVTNFSFDIWIKGVN